MTHNTEDIFIRIMYFTAQTNYCCIMIHLMLQLQVTLPPIAELFAICEFMNESALIKVTLQC